MGGGGRWWWSSGDRSGDKIACLSWKWFFTQNWESLFYLKNEIEYFVLYLEYFALHSFFIQSNTNIFKALQKKKNFTPALLLIPRSIYNNFLSTKEKKRLEGYNFFFCLPKQKSLLIFILNICPLSNWCWIITYTQFNH